VGPLQCHIVTAGGEARQYIINKLVAEQEQKLNEAKRMAQEKEEEEEEAKRQGAMHADPPGAAEYLGDSFPL
jgi:cellobiose-specific phosphotransferase system component IIA